MILRPRLQDHLIVGRYTGLIIVGVGALMAIPMAVSLLFREWNTALDFLIGAASCLVFGFGVQVLCRTEKDPQWSHGLVIVSGSWVWATALGAIPLWLSGHYGSFLDATFDVMSGFTTTGLYLLQDLDHVSYGVSMWRALLAYAGGQGIIVVALTFLLKGTGGTFKLYAGEGRDDRLLPNVAHTARAIWTVSLVWLAAGTFVLSILGLALGQRPERAVLHGMWMFMTAWSTGGFTPQSFSAGYYHSALYELVLIITMIAGSLGFALHWTVWTGRRDELWRNVETRSFAMTLGIVTTLGVAGLAAAHVYPDAVSLFRKGFFQLVSAHTTTGMMTIRGRTIVTQWGTVGMVAAAVAMALGGAIGSMSGGVKAMRVGVITRALFQDVRRVLSPDRAVISARFHHLRDIVLTDAMARAALTIAMLYMTTYVVLGIAGMVFGYTPAEALFEAVSATANAGLTCGVTQPDMPTTLKLLYMAAMWVGRLEFMSALTLVGYAWAMARGVRGR